jgi:hypothetical protein
MFEGIIHFYNGMWTISNKLGDWEHGEEIVYQHRFKWMVKEYYKRMCS